jgi:hypothetical protein
LQQLFLPAAEIPPIQNCCNSSVRRKAFTSRVATNYARFWQDTPAQDALNRHLAAGKPIGGSSAGLAMVGQFAFASMIDTIHSPEALANP